MSLGTAFRGAGFLGGGQPVETVPPTISVSEIVRVGALTKWRFTFDEAMGIEAVVDPEDFYLEVAAAEEITLSNPTWLNETQLQFDTSRPILMGETIAAGDVVAGAVADASGNPIDDADATPTNNSTLREPDLWQPFEWWQAEDAVDSTNFAWNGRVNGSSANLAQTSDSLEPGVSVAGANWNGRDTVTLNNDRAVASTSGTLTLAALRFLHNGAEDYELLILVRPDAGAGNDVVLATHSTVGTAGGIRVTSNPSSGEYGFSIYSSAGVQLSVVATGCDYEKESLVRIRFDESTGTVGLSVDGGTEVTDSGGTLEDIDPSGGLTLGATTNAQNSFQGEVPVIFISKTLADSTLVDKQHAYFLAEYGVAA